MIETVQAMAAELRRVHVPVFTSDLIMAAQALDASLLDDREGLRLALAACLAKGRDYRDTFDALFDLYFADTVANAGDGRGGGLADLSEQALSDLLLVALRHDNKPLLRELAAEAVTRHARIEPGRAVAGTYYIFRTLRALDVEGLRAVFGEAGLEGDDPPLDGPLGDLAGRLRAARADAAFSDFERIVESEVRRRLVADRGADAVAAALRTPLPTDADFLTASTEVVARMSEMVEPLARRLSRVLADEAAAASRPRIDIRGTIRRSLSTGGSPVTIRFLPPDPVKPRLVLIADISGSVASFAGFAIQLAYSLKSRFSSLRSFVFVDGVDEVTDLVSSVRSITDTTERINAAGLGVWADGHSDYGHALTSFVERHLDALDHRTTVLILGDARNNYRDPRFDALDEIRRAAARVYWLNPERRVLWADGDSVAREYEAHVDGAEECRNVRHLSNFIEKLA
jgi:uncharacterized protein with von Willebrand factor type A (vWA) domain